MSHDTVYNGYPGWASTSVAAGYKSWCLTITRCTSDAPTNCDTATYTAPNLIPNTCTH